MSKCFNIRSMVPSAATTKTFHFDCGDHHCKSITIDTETNDVYITAVANDLTLSRIKLVPEDWEAIATFAHSVKEELNKNTVSIYKEVDKKAS